MSPPIWVAIIVLLLGLSTWIGVHHSLKSKKIDMNISRIVMIGMVPSFVFAVTTMYLLVPAFYYLLIGTRLGWATVGGTSEITWRLATFVGAAALSLSPIAWITLLEDEPVESSTSSRIK